MRYFIALNLPDELKNDLFNLQTLVKDAKISWVSKKNLHLTLKFLGAIPEDKISIIKDRLSQISFPIFDIKLKDFGFFPSSKDPNIFWVSVVPEEKVISLQQKVDEVLLDLIDSNQKFVSHITLGRIKQVRRKDSFDKSIKAISLSNNFYSLTSFSLFSSELTKKGPMYSELKNVKMS